ncbi:methyltransferase domain-containing protein [Desulfallas sp. Bu1-1]|uniref:methyltransferase domain-containing protein n=1 Tax=Desulfallas sp. Bu1-1 TaxID=2787620 RepID=UPI00189F1EA9|nr:methyltransferase domain-containing protein [Desulfallas sp. Bu1-1]MBF7084078.1 methyltransferase domain-containing protein [Desulfallas sp. Bu1-1]
MQKLHRDGDAPVSFLIYQIKEPRFWEKAWIEAYKGSLHTRRRSGAVALDYWNRLAGRFARQAGQECTKRRVDRVLAWLEQQGILHSEMEVLDIGAGTGVFTVPLARRVKEVAALEPAPAMLAALQKRVEAEGLANVHFLDWEWEKFDPAAEGLAERFDLVFASLTPGVRDVQTLMKMTACSRDWCFLCDFAGRRLSPAREELWQLIFGEEMPLPGHDIIFPLNYLYASGYCPSFQVWSDEWDEELPVEEAVAGLQDFFRVYTEITPEIDKIIVDYVEQRAVKQIFCEKYRVRLGMILWQVAAKWAAEADAT